MKRLVISAVTIIVLGTSAYFLGGRNLFSRKQIGQPVDSLNGVIVFYNGKVGHVDGRNITADGYNLGLKFQCVEFVKRYYYQHLNHKMPDSYGHAKDFFDPSLEDGEKNSKRGLVQYSNPGKSKPNVDDLVVMDGHEFNPYGHVAIISEVTDSEIEIIQQNPGPSSSSREKIMVEQTNGNWRIKSGRVLGWLRKE